MSKKIWMGPLLCALSVFIMSVMVHGESSSLEFIQEAVRRGMEEGVSDPGSEVVRDFLTASDMYDGLDEEGLSRIPEKTAADLKELRQALGDAIRICDGVSTGNARADQWYIRTHAENLVNAEEILTALREMEGYEGSAPELIWCKNISYTDVRTGEEAKHSGMVSLTFPVPEGYESYENPKVFTIYNGRLMELAPRIEEQGCFYVQRAKTLSDIIIADMPIPLAGIGIEEEASVNAGQKLALQVSPLPSGTTENYQVAWKSSNPQTAEVDQEGTVTGVKTGTAFITASVVGKENIEAVCQIRVVQGAHDLGDQPWQVMEETRAHMLSIDKKPTIGSGWFAIGLSRSGMDLGSSYFSSYYNRFANYMEENKGVLTKTIKYTEYSKAVLAMTSIGKDARDIAGYNLLANLSDFETVKAQGINGPIWALLALKANPKYSIPEDPKAQVQTTEQALVDYIVSQEMPTGGWALMGEVGDTDVTGMALQALAPYYHREGYGHVTEAIDRALDFLSQVQRPTGGYATMGVETVESCVQVLTGLCSLGIDPETDERFVKGGCWTVENLLSYHIPGSGFMHVKPGAGNNGGGAAGQVDGIATEQGFYALAAYKRLKEGKTGLYDMSDMDISPGGKGDGTGTGLETPAPSLTPTPTPPGRKPSRNDPGNGNRSPSITPTPSPSPSGQGTGAQTRPEAQRLSSSSVSKNALSSNSSKKKAGKGGDGWDFQGEAYAQAEEGWDTEGIIEEAADMDTGPSDEAPRPAHPFTRGTVGGALGAGLLELVLFLVRKYRKWQILGGK